MISPFLSNKPTIPSMPTQIKSQENDIIQDSKANIFIRKHSISTKDDQQKLDLTKTNSIASNKSSIKVMSHVLTRRSPEGYKNLRAKTIRVGKIRWPPPMNSDETDHESEQRRLLLQRRIQEEIHGNEQIAKDNVINNKKSLLPDNNVDKFTNDMNYRNKKSLEFVLDRESYQLRKNLFEHLNKSLYIDPIAPFIDEVNTSKLSTRQYPIYLTYNNIQWKLKIRKEVFSPNETFEQPLLIELLYLQIVHDVFSSVCIRVSEAERTNMKIFLSTHAVATISDIGLIKTLTAKKDIIEQARQWSIYFCRLFPVSTFMSHTNEEQYLGVSHSGIRLIKRNRTAAKKDILQVLETFPFDTIQYISPVRNDSNIELTLSKKRITLHSHWIRRIRQMIEEYVNEFQTDKNKQHQGSDDHKKSTPPPLSNTSDFFKSSSQTSLLSYSQTFSELIPSTSFEIHTPKSAKNDISCSNLAALPTGHSMMEFALQNFKVPNRRRSKKKCKTSDWTWQDYAELIKWSKNPIEAPLLRHSSKEPMRIVRQCFLCIMRFMGDHTMTRGQTDIDCLHYLLKTMHKHRNLIDEVFCQIVKQLTDNKSVKTDSIQRGWKLLVVILNYFVPSEHFQPYLVKYLQDSQIKNERLVQLCIKHYQQTIKSGGRKNAPSKGEVDLLTANDQNAGKCQKFLLPGGYSLNLVTTPSMVIDDCLNMLCEHLSITNTLEIDEYSIFIISASDQSSRQLNPKEYLFDLISECLRLNIMDFYFIMKRILWFNIPFTFNTNNQTEIFIHFMYHQILPDLRDGTMIALNNNHLSDDFMQEIALMAALQYRASNQIGLPTLREIKSLLPATILQLKNVRPQQWTEVIHDKLNSFVESTSIIDAKSQFLNLIKAWPLFGTTFFYIESIDDPSIRSPCFIGISKNGIMFLDLDTREILFSISYDDVVSIRRHQNSIAIKFGSLSEPDILLCQLDKAQDSVTLIGRYLSLIGRSLTSAMDRKSDTQHMHRSSTSNDAISTIL